MHELALTQGIISIVESEAKKNSFDRVLEIRLRVGEYSGIITGCLEEFFPIAAKGTHAENASLVIENVKAEFTCPDCGHVGDIDKTRACCPECGSFAVKLTAGREFYVESLKVE